jgi:transcriptional regulator NrdR family protein
MICPQCSSKTDILESRASGPNRSRKRRRRVCTNDRCQYRFTTFEIQDTPMLQLFLRGRLTPKPPRQSLRHSE